jgi:hypothetical protein
MRRLTPGRGARQHASHGALAVLLVATVAELALVAATWRAPASARARVGSDSMPAGLPSHFSFGLMDAPGGASALDSMRQRNGTAWDYRYQYLAGGVNTGAGWSTWNQPAGAFATYYLQESASHGYRPAFVYYNLLQSKGPAGSGEAGTDLAHLADPTTMHAYYADWTLLMQHIGAAAGGQPVLVVVEPDLWGFIEQAAVRVGSNSAASVPASVASAGNAALAGLPNTAQGFALALLTLRARYAPNAVLALHASPWGTLTDIASNTSASLDAAGLGRQTAAFLRTAGLAGTPGLPAGIAPFDLVSADIADHDSGQSGIWWDLTNTTFPNFARYLTYASALTSSAGAQLLLWQVPVGNQVYETEDNSRGHTQDNKATYIVGHVAALAAAGIVGVLFGPGNGGTTATDGRRDGITNGSGAPISSYKCARCNTQVSIYPDDDGGYLRLQLGSYYTHGAYPPPGKGNAAPASKATATPARRASPAATGTRSAASIAGSASRGGALGVVPWLVGGGLLVLGGAGGAYLRRRQSKRERAQKAAGETVRVKTPW